MMLSHITATYYVNDKGLVSKKKEETDKELTIESARKILEVVDTKQSTYYDYNIKQTMQDMKKAITQEFFLIEAINAIDDTSRIINTLTKRLRDWYALMYPEDEHYQNNEALLKSIFNPKKSSKMGAKGDLKPLQQIVKQIEQLQRLKEHHELFIKKTVKDFAPNLYEVAGPIITARLLTHSRSLKRLSQMPASTVQILGAEEALFRHLKTGAKPPRHGLIVAHPLLASAPQQKHGRIARVLADKISLAAKIDYFKGEFRGTQLRKELEQKVK